MVIRIHTALRAEAAPLNAHFGLSLLERRDEYCLFGKGQLQLLISGSGSGRVQHAFDAFDEKKWGRAVWFNIGIAGSAEFSFTTPVSISHVYNDDEQQFALGIVKKSEAHLCDGVLPLVSTRVKTVVSPSRDYPQDGVIDMELWHVCHAVGAQNVYALKIISDTPQLSFLATKKQVKELIRNALGPIEYVLKQIRQITSP